MRACDVRIGKMSEGLIMCQSWFLFSLLCTAGSSPTSSTSSSVNPMASLGALQSLAAGAGAGLNMSSLASEKKAFCFWICMMSNAFTPVIEINLRWCDHKWSAETLYQIKWRTSQQYNVIMYILDLIHTLVKHWPLVVKVAEMDVKWHLCVVPFVF